MTDPVAAHPTVAKLVAEARDGDHQAFERLVGRFRQMAEGYALALLRDPGLAEDAVQEANLEAFLNLSQLREDAAFPGWFRRLVLKHADRQRRKRLLHEELADMPGAVDPLADLIAAEERRQVVDSVRALPARLRDAVQLFYSSDLSVAEVAEFLEIAPSAVKKRLFDARARLRTTLGESVSRAAVNANRGGGRTMATDPTKLIETGVKAVDLYAPLVHGGTLAIHGDPGAGEVVLAMEIAHKLRDRQGITAHWFVAGDAEWFRQAVRECQVAIDVQAGMAPTRMELRRGTEVVATLVLDEPGSADSWVTMRTDLLRSGQIPAVDAASSGTRLDLPEHADVAERARERVAAGSGAGVLAFLRQWFFVAKPWTGQEEEYSPLEATLAGVLHLAR
jgi:RNA polymerase sigma factor (sigma-70 family)